MRPETEDCRDRRAASARQMREWRKRNRERNKANERNWAASNREKRRKSCKEWYYRNLEAQRARCRETRHREWSSDREKVIARNRAWFRNNPARIIQNHTKRMTLLKKSARNTKLISRWMVATRKKTGVRCYYCGDSIYGKDIRFDHIVPVSRGGPHAIENLCCTCHPCNSSKHAKRVSEWLKAGQLIFDL